MSGPKIDAVELERRRQEQLERERQEQLKQIKIQTDYLLQVQQEERLFCEWVQKEDADRIQICAAFADMQDVIAMVQQAKKNALQTIQGNMAQAIATEPETIHLQAQQRKKDLQTVKKAYQRAMRAPKERMKSRLRDASNDKAYQRFADAIAKTHQTTPAQVVDVSFVVQQVEQVTHCTSQVKTQVKAHLGEIEAYVNNPATIPESKALLLALVEKMQKCVENNGAGLQSVETEYVYVRPIVQKQIQEMQRLYQNYVAEFVAYTGHVNTIRPQKMRQLPKAQHLFTSQEMLQKELESLQEKAKAFEKNHYIRTQLCEVMATFQYTLCDDIVMGVAGSEQHYLCNKVGENTAIHLHISESDQFMMEVVAYAETPQQTPTDPSVSIAGYDQLSPDEVEALLAEQTAFCSMHPQIIAELKKRGVVLRAKEHRPPQAKSCKKITRVSTSQPAAQNATQHRTKKKTEQEQQTAY